MTTITDVHRTFRDWFNTDYDLDAINAALATFAAEKLDGDPLWLLEISGSGNAKTETLSALGPAGAYITSTIASDGALLSASPTRERAKDATGGLLKKIGASGVLVVKDFTSILSMNVNTRTPVLAALREVYDGRWERNVGTDGGRTLTWTGRIAVIGACTTAWDRAHDVIASMGDRFVVIRMDSSVGRIVAGYKAMANTGDEVQMRQQLGDVVARLLAHVTPAAAIKASVNETDLLLAAADVVTRCRTGVDFDYRGDVIDCHQPEMPTRFAKQLVQMLRGACAVGISRPEALALALRCARDSMPPLRLKILEDVYTNSHTRASDVRRRLNKPYTTIDRQLQALHMLGVLDCDEVQRGSDEGRGKTSWYYSVNPDINVGAIRASPEKLLTLSRDLEREGQTLCAVSHISGDGFPARVQ